MMVPVRLFVALFPPADVIDDLRVHLDAVDLPGVRRELPERWHVTLQFLGEVSGPVHDALVAELPAVVHRHPALRLSLGGGGQFGERVLWSGVRGELAALRALAADLRAGAVRCGVAGSATDDRPYRPHLTVGKGIVAPATGLLHDHSGPMWTVREVHLVRSVTGPDGVLRYSVLATWPLA